VQLICCVSVERHLIDDRLCSFHCSLDQSGDKQVDGSGLCEVFAVITLSSNYESGNYNSCHPFMCPCICTVPLLLLVISYFQFFDFGRGQKLTSAWPAMSKWFSLGDTVHVSTLLSTPLNCMSWRPVSRDADRSFTQSRERHCPFAVTHFWAPARLLSCKLPTLVRTSLNQNEFP